MALTIKNRLATDSSVMAPCNRFQQKGLRKSSSPMVGKYVSMNQAKQKRSQQKAASVFVPLPNRPLSIKASSWWGWAWALTTTSASSTRTTRFHCPRSPEVMELPLKHNIGVGVSGGMMQWSPKSSEGAQYTYWCISPRMAYHLNFAEQVDLYAGVAVTGRFATMEAGDGENSISLKNNHFDASAFAGLRYYFNKILDVYGEYGDDNIACARLGLAFRFAAGSTIVNSHFVQLIKSTPHHEILDFIAVVTGRPFWGLLQRPFGYYSWAEFYT